MPSPLLKKKVKVLGIPFDVVTKDLALKRITDAIASPAHEGAKHVATPNPEILLEAQNNQEFRAVLNKTWMNIPDGIGILWAATFQNSARGKSRKWLHALLTLASLAFFPKYCRKIFPERITGTDLMESLCSMSRSSGTPIFLLGAKNSVGEKAKEILEIRYPGINIVGTFSGSPLENDFPRIQSMIAETQPKILFVAYGAPNQELWINQHLHKLKSVKIAMGVGGAFDFLAGVKKRAPKWMQRLGLEWLYRLFQEPSRIRRIWNATIKFPRAVITSVSSSLPRARPR